MRRTLIAVLCAVTLFAIGARAQEIEIVHMHDPAHAALWFDWLEESAQLFEEANPGVKITILVPASRDEHQDKIIAMYATQTLPDVIEVFPASYYQFQLDGVFQSLDPFMEKEEEFGWDQFFPAAEKAAQVAQGHPGAGSHWLLPASIWTVAYAFNHDMFNEAGVTIPSQMDHHWTWDDALDIGEKLTQLNPDGTVKQYGIEISPSLGRSLVWFHNADALPVDRYIYPTESLLLDDRVRDTFDYLHNVWQRAQVSQIPGGVDAPEAADIAGPNFTANYIDSGQTYEYSLGPNPMKVRGGSENVTIGFAMGAQSKHPEIVWKWMKFLVTERARAHIEITGRPVGWGEAARDYEELMPNASEWEHVWIEIIANPDSYERPVWTTQVMDVIGGALNDIAAGESAVGPVVESAHAQLQAIFAEMN